MKCFGNGIKRAGLLLTQNDICIPDYDLWHGESAKGLNLDHRSGEFS